MPAKSKTQQQFMGLVRKCQKTGECASPEIKKAADSMEVKDVKDFAETKHKGLPKKVTEGKLTFRKFLLSENMDESGFNEYMRRVDRVLEAKFGVGYMDLPDYLWRDAYENELDPRDAVQDFIEYHGDDLG